MLRFVVFRSTLHEHNLIFSVVEPRKPCAREVMYAHRHGHVPYIGTFRWMRASLPCRDANCQVSFYYKSAIDPGLTPIISKSKTHLAIGRVYHH